MSLRLPHRARRTSIQAWRSPLRSRCSSPCPLALWLAPATSPTMQATAHSRGRSPSSQKGVPAQDGAFCGGTLIAADRVLTAAHCIDPDGIYQRLPPTCRWWWVRPRCAPASQSPDLGPIVRDPGLHDHEHVYGARPATQRERDQHAPERERAAQSVRRLDLHPLRRRDPHPHAADHRPTTPRCDRADHRPAPPTRQRPTAQPAPRAGPRQRLGAQVPAPTSSAGA